MHRFCFLCCATLLATLSHASATEEDSSFEALQAKLEELQTETKATEAQTEALEAVIQEREAELLRLKAQAKTLSEQLNPARDPSAEDGPVPSDSPNLAERRNELIRAARERIVFLKAGDETLGTAFLGMHEGGARIFTSGSLIGGHEEITVTNLEGATYEIAGELTSPRGVELVCLHPTEEELPHFPLASLKSLPGIADQVLVLVTNPETNEVTGTTGRIRGIGPDTWELDANLTPDMNGAPVVALETGEVVGIVSPQIAGAVEDWAQGTRHEGARSFASRIDRIQAGESIDFERFGQEAAYLERYNERTYLNWLAHMLAMDTLGEANRGDGNDKLHDAIDERSGEEQVARVKDWATRYKKQAGSSGSSNSKIDSRTSLRNRLAYIYLEMEKELKTDNHDISDKFSYYHAQSYARARQWREAGIREMAAMRAKLRN